jgi:predicted ABC-class ATPase
MRDKEEFFSILKSIDGQSAVEYSKLIGDFDFSRYVLKVNSIQREAAGLGQYTLFVLRVPQIIAGFPAHLFNTPVRRVALEDYLTRKVAAQMASISRYEGGLSRRRLFIACPGQKILPRSSMVVTEEYIETRVYVELPEAGGKVAGDAAQQVFFEDMPAVVNGALIYCNLNEAEVNGFVNQMEDADHVRRLLATRGWVGFVADGAMLRRADNGDLPDYAQWVGVSVADECAVNLDAPNAGTIRGVGIPAGVTVILGDSASGRVDLMRALADGIYNHIPGDGREAVITVPDAVYVNAEPGRGIQRVDISAFIRPGGDATAASDYSTTCADALVSQAAAFVEALEAGARAILLDESDSASEFLALSAAAAALMPQLTDSLTPLSVRARSIADELGVTLVIGGTAAAAQFVPVADAVFRIEGHRISDITKTAKAIFKEAPIKAPPADLPAIVDRVRRIIPSSIDPSVGRFDAGIEAPSVHTLRFGRYTVDLSACRQLADVYQTLTIGRILYYAKLRYMDEPRPVREVLDLIDRDLSTDGLESLTRDLRGDLARPRRYEIAAALNRLRSLRISREAAAT